MEIYVDLVLNVHPLQMTQQVIRKQGYYLNQKCFMFNYVFLFKILILLAIHHSLQILVRNTIKKKDLAKRTT